MATVGLRPALRKNDGLEITVPLCRPMKHEAMLPQIAEIAEAGGQGPYLTSPRRWSGGCPRRSPPAPHRRTAARVRRRSSSHEARLR